MLIELSSQGILPPGIDSLSWHDFEEMVGCNAQRTHLLHGLKRALGDLKVAVCQTAYIDGSFVTTKERPNDFDACWDRTGVELRRLLDTPLSTFDRGRAR